MGLFRRRRGEEDPLAALRGDGSSPFGDPGVSAAPAPGPVPAAAPMPAPAARQPQTQESGRIAGRILARRDTGVLIAGAPRARVSIEVVPPGQSPFVIETHVLVGPGRAADPGDLVDIELEDGRPAAVHLRPAIRPAGPRG